MKLYSGPLSLFARKVEIALYEKNIAFERVMVNFDQSVGYTPKHPAVLAANPKGQVPVLIDKDLVIYDSTVILEYLEDAYPSPPLYPKSAVARANCRLLELYADEIMLIPLKALMHRTEHISRESESWKDKEQKAIAAEAILAKNFETLETRLNGETYFCGELSIADIALFMMVHWVLRLGGTSLKPYVHLSAWYKNLLTRASFLQIVNEVAFQDQKLSAPIVLNYIRPHSLRPLHNYFH